MIRIALLIASTAIQALSMPAAASECSSATEIAASQANRPELRRQSAHPEQTETMCRDYAASFYRTVLARQAAVACGVGRKGDLAALDSEINALNDLLATKCGG
jgi:hypothetical protein